MKQNVNLINIIPKQYSNLLTIRIIVRVIAAILILLGLISTMKYFEIKNLNEKYKNYLTEKRLTQKQIANLKKKNPKVEKDLSLEIEQKKLEEYITLSEQLINNLQSIKYGNSNGFGDYLKEFALKKTELENVWLTKINIQDGGAYILLEGNSTDVTDVHTYINNLSHSDLFAEYGVVLKNIKTSVSSNNYDNFIIMLEKKSLDEGLVDGG